MRPTFALGILLTLVSITFAQTGPTSALINEALDQNVKLELNTTLGQAMNAIADKTGVRVEAEKAVWELLPWGEQTNVTANIDNTPLRTALDAIARKLGLSAVLTEKTVELRPLPALKRLGRRATLDELQALDLLASTPLRTTSESTKAKDLFATIDSQLATTSKTFVLENRVGLEINERTVSIRRGATLLDALDLVDAQTEATWHPSGRTIAIVLKEDQVRQQLTKHVTRNYNGVPIGQVLTELSQLAGVDFNVEPGAYQRIAPEFRTIKLLLDNASIEQALEHIAGFTGLGYVVNPRGVYFWAASTGTPTTTGRDPMVALVEVLPGVQVMVPQSQVNPQVRDQLRTLTQEKLAEMQKTPTSLPTTQPAIP